MELQSLNKGIKAHGLVLTTMDKARTLGCKLLAKIYLLLPIPSREATLSHQTNSKIQPKVSHSLLCKSAKAIVKE